MTPAAGSAVDRTSARRHRLSEETRRNLIALAVAAGALAAIVAFAARPAALLPVGTAALENSLESEFGDGYLFGESDLHDPTCRGAPDRGFTCSITRFPPDAGSSSDFERSRFQVRVGTLGCWTAVPRGRDPQPVEGCISIVDYFGY